MAELSGNVQNSVAADEHINENVKAKRVGVYGYDLTNNLWRRLAVTPEGALLPSGLVPADYDFVDLDPPSQPTTVTYKKGGSGGTTVATLTITYSGSDVETVTRT